MIKWRIFMSDSFFDKAKQWGSNAATSLQTSATNAVGGISNTASTISKKFGEAFSNPTGLVTKQTTTNEKPLTETSQTMMDAYKTTRYDLFPIGRPCKFNEQIDKYQRFGNYLRTKMSVIDLIPVDYGFDFTRMAKIVGLKEGEVKNDSAGDMANMFNIGYKDQINVYGRILKYHGLYKYAGIRLYTTDDTTANDTIQIGYKDSTFQSIANTMSEVGQNVKDIAGSLFGSEKAEFQKKVVEATKETSKKLAETSGLNSTTQQLVGDLASVASDMIVSGNKMTFPKVWQSTTYAGNLSVNIRLVSPYGHPKAVKEFILKPLSYLILLAAPQTINGVTYGGSIPLTIRAYGLNYTVLGSLASITFRRGGSDTSFNLYRQPLTIDLSLEFQTLFDAFAVFDPGPSPSKNAALKYDSNIFNDKSLYDPDKLGRFAYDKSSSLHMMTSLGTILTSLKPIGLMDAKANPQVYGVFDIPSRDDIPDLPTFTPITGNLGSSISGAVDSIGKFGSLITNAPTLLKQGLANAVYNTAKGSIGSIAGSASKYIGNVGGAASKVVNTIKGNLF
jgi:hypothetical protein